MQILLGSGLIIAITVFWLGLTWRFANWQKWREYYPSVLFVFTWDFINTILTYDYKLWHYEKTWLGPTHVMADFGVVFLNLAPIILLYLSRYPYQSSVAGQVGYIALWVGFNSFVEAIFGWLERVTYLHGWGFWWSVVLWSLLFLIVRIHLTRPIMAWLITLCVAWFVISYFNIPLLGR
ncbi:CBO0543 family protein [Tumebacillus permanentifrigoris]|uniref:Carotenoid biosynthesis protein n=1 Tax=Tumebacillus permanentifrigoris TaxID=378543 RepID=A0A316DBX9_9BACL|nr:CBO0543 family protein [Tumebacillus permanentifrigoris]PWK13733.1 hypothetical protein C7459_10611 [Tumebacillus permanentifrigoris]